MSEQLTEKPTKAETIESWPKGKNKLPLKKENFEQTEFQTRLEKEKKEIREQYKDLIDLVNQRYEQGILSPDQLVEFKQHNEEILDFSLELALRKKFKQEEIRILSMAAILHDLTKADPLPAEISHIKSYNLIAHGQQAAQESKEILTNDYLEKHGFENYSVQELERVRKEVSQAIDQHMGPHPGFMSNELRKANQALIKEGKPPIEHPVAQGKISKTLLAADMGSLAGLNGLKKVLSVRAAGENFQKTDQETVGEYKKMGLDLRPGEAALLSGFESGRQAVAMIKDPQDRAWIETLFEESKKAEYYFAQDPQPLNFETAIGKKKEFEEKSKIEAAREQLTQAE